MTIYILVETKNGSPNANAAFSTEEKRQAYIDTNEIETPKFDFFEAPEHFCLQKPETEKQPTTEDEEAQVHVVLKKLFAAHAMGEDGLIQIAGYFPNKFDAVVAAGEKGFVNKLDIDQIKDEEPSLAKKNKKKKPLTFDTLEDETSIPLPIQTKKKPSYFEENFKAFAILAASVILLLIGLKISNMLNPEVQFAENVKSVDWLPANCENISYFKSKNLQAYEFSAPYDGFIKWAKAEKLEYKRINNQPFRVPTYRRYAEVSMLGYEGLSEKDKWEKWEAVSNPIIKNGVQIIKKKDEPNMSVNGGYDIQTGRVYFWAKRLLKE